MWIFHYFRFERGYDVLKSKSHEICSTKISSLIKAKKNRQWKIQHTVLERWTFCYSSYKNHKLKIKLCWDGACKRNKRAFFVPFILFERNFFNICVLSQYIVSWMPFQNIHTLLKNIRNITSYTFCLFFKIVESLQCIFK